MTTVLIAIFVTVFDQLVKWIVVSHMELGETIPLIRNVFHLTYILNPGAAFGLLPHQDPNHRRPIKRLKRDMAVWHPTLLADFFRVRRGLSDP